MAVTETPELAWEVAHLFPPQGQWTEEEYIALTNGTNRLVELSEGRIEVLPMPSWIHQKIVMYLYRLFFAILEEHGRAIVAVAPLRIRLWEGKIREPDVMVVRSEHLHLTGNTYFTGADLVVEMISNDDPSRDLVTKRAEYAQAGIPEYWIVDPRDESMTVLRLDSDVYAEHGRFERGGTATSALFEGVVIDVAELFDAAN